MNQNKFFLSIVKGERERVFVKSKSLFAMKPIFSVMLTLLLFSIIFSFSVSALPRDAELAIDFEYLLEGNITQNITNNYYNTTTNITINETQFVSSEPLSINQTWLESLFNALTKWTEYFTKTESDGRYLQLNQSTPQEIINGIPLLQETRVINETHQLVDKLYVDTVVSSLGMRFYMLNTSSGVESYYIACPLGCPQESFSLSYADLTDGQYVGGWISPENYSMSSLIAGIYEWHIFSEKTAGTRDLRVYWTLVERLGNGTEIVIETSAQSNLIDAKVNLQIPLLLSEDYKVFNESSRIVGKIYAVVGASGSAPTLTLYGGNDENSHWEIPTNKEFLDSIYYPLTTNPNNYTTNISALAYVNSSGYIINWSEIIDVSNYVPYTGATGDVNLGDNSLTSKLVIITGNSESPILAFSDVNDIDEKTNILLYDYTENALVFAGLDSGGDPISDTLYSIIGNLGVSSNISSNFLNSYEINGSIINGSYLYTSNGLTQNNINLIKLSSSNGILIGSNAGFDATGTIITAIGLDAGRGNTGNNLIALGESAGRLNTGLSQLAVGYYAGYDNDGLFQSAIGYNAGRENRANYQSAFGQTAGYRNTGADQTAFGASAGYTNTGSPQSAIGSRAGYNNSGDYQLALGAQAGEGNIADDQVAIGDFAGYYNTGIGQTAIGVYTGFRNNGSRVIAIGRTAGHSNIGNDSIFLGYYAGYENTENNKFIVKQNNINTIPLIKGDFLTGDINLSGDLLVNGTVYYGALESLSPHAFLDDEVGYTRICKKAVDGNVVMEVIEFNNITGKYETNYLVNQEDCNKILLQQSIKEIEPYLVNGVAVDIETTTKIYKDIWTKEYETIIQQTINEIQPYKINTFYDKGDRVIYNDVPYEIIQRHVSQSDWIPSQIPSLYKVLILHEYNEITEWVQPQGSHDCYPIGALVTYQGNTYESIVDCNVWSPLSYGWSIV